MERPALELLLQDDGMVAIVVTSAVTGTARTISVHANAAAALAEVARITEDGREVFKLPVPLRGALVEYRLDHDVYHRAQRQSATRSASETIGRRLDTVFRVVGDDRKRPARPNYKAHACAILADDGKPRRR